MKSVTLRPMNRRQFACLAGLGSLSLFRGIANAQRWPEGLLRPLPENISKLDLPQPLVYAVWRYIGTLYYFEPMGLLVQPGEKVGFVIGGTSGRTPTITAYHPNNDNHELRIPENAKPFDSGELVRSRTRPAWEITFDVEGTYDYYSKYEEWNGMIGRIIVGRPGGAGEKPWGYGNKEGRKPIPPEVLRRAKLLDSQTIVRQKTTPFPLERIEEFRTPYPLW